MKRILRITLKTVIVLLAFIGLAFIGLRLYSEWYFSSGKSCTESATYGLGEADSRYQISKQEYQLIFEEAESRFEQKFGRDVLTYTGVEPDLKYEIEYNEEASGGDVLYARQKEEYLILQKEVALGTIDVEQLKQEYVQASSTLWQYVDHYQSLAPTESFDGLTQSQWFDRVNSKRLEVNELSRLVTEKAFEINEKVGRVNELGSILNSRSFDFGDPIDYRSTPFDYAIMINYFINKEHLRDLIQTSFESVILHESEDVKESSFRVNKDSEVDREDLIFRICT